MLGIFLTTPKKISFNLGRRRGFPFYTMVQEITLFMKLKAALQES